MHTINYSLGELGRCGALWRTGKLINTDLGPYDHAYLFYICRHPASPQESLCRALCVNKSHVTRHLTRLEEKGFVLRTPSEKDRRVLLVSPTDKALEILPFLREMSAEWLSILTADFSPEETEQFGALLDRALENAKNAAFTAEGEDIGL